MLVTRKLQGGGRVGAEVRAMGRRACAAQAQQACLHCHSPPAAILPALHQLQHNATLLLPRRRHGRAAAAAAAPAAMRT